MREPDDPRVSIQAQGLGICYRRYRRRMMTLKEAAVNLFRGSKYEQHWALRDIDLTVHRGESIGIIGPNGAGKSTLLKAIAGILAASEGEIRTRGRVAPMINLGAGFNNELTGRENILLNGAIMGLSKKEMNGRMERIIEFADIGDAIDTPVNTYSSGMRARLGFAVVSDVDADILLLDEIFSVGDQEFRAKAGARTEAFFHSDRTVVVVSHNLDLVENLCDRAVLLEKGHVKACGPMDEIVEIYKSDFEKKQSQKKQAS